MVQISVRGQNICWSRTDDPLPEVPVEGGGSTELPLRCPLRDHAVEGNREVAKSIWEHLSKNIIIRI